MSHSILKETCGFLMIVSSPPWVNELNDLPRIKQLVKRPETSIWILFQWNYKSFVGPDQLFTTHKKNIGRFQIVAFQWSDFRGSSGTNNFKTMFNLGYLLLNFHQRCVWWTEISILNTKYSAPWNAQRESGMFSLSRYSSAPKYSTGFILFQILNHQIKDRRKS